MVEGEGVTDWKAWMGSASKNSWAKIKGVLVGSIRKEVDEWTTPGKEEALEGRTVRHETYIFTPRYRKT